MKKYFLILFIFLFFNHAYSSEIVGKKLICKYDKIYYGINFVKEGIGKNGNAIIYEIDTVFKGWKVIKNKGLAVDSIPIELTPNKIRIGNIGTLDRENLTYRQLGPKTNCNIVNQDFDLDNEMNKILDLLIKEQKEKNKI